MYGGAGCETTQLRRARPSDAALLLLPPARSPLQRLGVRKALVVHSAGLDELTPMAPADVVEVTQQGALRLLPSLAFILVTPRQQQQQRGARVVLCGLVVGCPRRLPTTHILCPLPVPAQRFSLF